MTSQTNKHHQLIDKLWQIHNARKAITGLLQATEATSGVGTMVEFHQLGNLLNLLDELELTTLKAL